jgi:putative nucleotidyltransferase with HDIG domain
MDIKHLIHNIGQRQSLLERHVGFKLEAILHTALEARDSYTDAHCNRVIHLAEAMGRWLGLDESQMTVLSLAAGFHDIGKIGIPDQVLLKPARLTPDEYDIIKTHPQIGANMLRSLGDPLLDQVAECVLHHHENWDGSGYPSGLSDDQIPLLSRIIAVVDAYDAITTTRAYRKAMPQSEAIRIIEQETGTHFCPETVDILIKLLRSETIGS